MKLNDLLRTTLRLGNEVHLSDDLGPGKIVEWDSLGHVNLMTALENTYKISIDVDDVIGIENIKDIKSFLHKKGRSDVFE